MKLDGGKEEIEGRTDKRRMVWSVKKFEKKKFEKKGKFKKEYFEKNHYELEKLCAKVSSIFDRN